MLKIVTWNINGIRSIQPNLKDVFDSLDADIIALQETKITRDMLDEPTALVEGYNSYYSFCRKKSGYSGVATYCRSSVTPFLAEEGIAGTFNNINDRIENYSNIHRSFTDDQLKDLDAEGRCVMTLHKFKEGENILSLVVINVYCPHACENEERLTFKLQFYKALELRCRDMLEQGFRVIVLGDINVSHRLIDHCEPEDAENFSKSPSRIWLDGFLAGFGDDNFVDSFRFLYPTKEKSFTCWMTQINARVNNYGTRIDYIFLSSKLVPTLKDSLIMADVHGSDHCPVKSLLHIEMISSTKTPALCTKNYKEFAGRQLKMSTFFCKRGLEEADKLLESDSKKMRAVKMKQQSSLLQYFSQPQKTKFDCLSSVETATITKEESTEVLQISTLPSSSSSQSAALWKNVFKGAPPPPLCKGHQEVCVLRTVKKKGPNMNRQFWACPKAAGHSADPNAQCNFFQWVISKR